jgi:hypothetical protein
MIDNMIESWFKRYFITDTFIRENTLPESPIDRGQEIIDNTPEEFKGNYSDGYHTFNELYEFRLQYNAALFNEWASYKIEGLLQEKYNVHKSWKHSDGEYCFGPEKEWFIVSAMLPTGLISNHYKAEHWDLFKVPEVEKAMFEYDGHTAQDVLTRLRALSE